MGIGALKTRRDIPKFTKYGENDIRRGTKRGEIIVYPVHWVWVFESGEALISNISSQSYFPSFTSPHFKTNVMDQPCKRCRDTFLMLENSNSDRMHRVRLWMDHPLLELKSRRDGKSISIFHSASLEFPHFLHSPPIMYPPELGTLRTSAH